MSGVRDTVLGVMRDNYDLSRYTNYATPVIEALEERERGIAEAILAAAVEEGLSPERARAALVEAGMEVRAASNGDTDRIEAVESQLVTLLDEIRSMRR